MTMMHISTPLAEVDRAPADSAAGTKVSALPLPSPNGVPGPPENEQPPLLPSNGAREQGFVLNTDKVNRFLLCALVIDSAKKIKGQARDLGEDLPLSTVVRGVLECYNTATMENRVSLAGSDPNVWSLTKLNAGVLSGEMRRHMKKQVTRRQAQLDYAHHLGDAPRIQFQQEALAHATTARDQLAREVT